ncbi:MAG: glycosyltransferase 87 family protein [bacterium]|nr:glycosyltransferase 87 family protein [bacterium]
MFNSNLNPLVRIAILISIFIALAGFIADFRYTKEYGGVDLRNRVVGTRVAVELKQDPYYYKWTPEQSDRYLDPSDNAAIPVTRLTVTPAVIQLYSVFSSLPYSQIRYLWFFVQWACLIGSIILLAKISGDDIRARAYIWILGLVGISGSMFWRLHAERGQMYIIYVFLFCLALYWYKKYENKPTVAAFPAALIGSGLVLGYLISLRPTYVFSLIPILIYKKYKLASIITAGMLASVLLSSLISPVPLWKNYYESIQLQGAMRLDESINYRAYDTDIAEGINLKKFLPVPGEDSSLQTIFRGIFNTWFTSSSLFILLVIFLGIISAGLAKFKIRQIGGLELFFMASTLSFSSEFFIAASRWPYANVIWLIPLCIMLIEREKIISNTLVLTAYTLAAVGLLVNIGFHLIPRLTFAGDAGIPIATLIFLLALIMQRSKEPTQITI